MVKSLGAEQVIDYTKEDFSNKGEIYDVIFDTVGKSSFSACMKSLKNDGTYINIRCSVTRCSNAMEKIDKEQEIILGRNSPETPEALGNLKDLVETGKLKVVIDRYFQIEEIVEAHRYVEQGHKRGNVVINLEQNSKS